MHHHVKEIKKIYKKELFTPLVNIYPKKYYGNCYASCKSKSFINLFKVNSDGLNKKNELYHTEKPADYDEAVSKPNMSAVF